MPLVRIDLPAGKSPEYHSHVADVIYAAMTETLNVPKDDQFIIINAHAPTDLIINAQYLNIQRSADALIVQITLNEGRTVELKKAFYKAVAEGLHAKVGLRLEDVFISLVEVKKENWSFGNGMAQYA